jgi:putative toxin-antitoxin system antitoxin component (TIGR02293 family)
MYSLGDVAGNIRIADPLQLQWVAANLPLAEISTIRELAHVVFEDADTAEAWLLEPNLALNNQRPIELIGRPSGFDTVKNLLLRIQYGVLA